MSTEALKIGNAGPGEVEFYSRYGNLVLVRQPAIDETLVGGQRKIIQKGEKIRFAQGVYRARVGKRVLVDHYGWLAPGQEEEVERDEVDALRAHRRFNKDFWEVGREPGRLQPYDEQILEWLTEAVAALDVDRLQQLLTGERETHNRVLLVRALEKALETTKATRIKIEAEANDAAAAAAEVAKTKPAKGPAKTA